MRFSSLLTTSLVLSWLVGCSGGGGQNDGSGGSGGRGSDASGDGGALGAGGGPGGHSGTSGNQGNGGAGGRGGGGGDAFAMGGSGGKGGGGVSGATGGGAIVGSGGQAGSRGLGGATGGTPGCGTLANIGTPVTPTALSGVITSYTGGSVADGTYLLTAVQQTDAIAVGETYQRTLSIASQGTTFQWAIDDVNVSGSGHLDLAGSLTLVGSSFNFGGTCAPTDNYHYSSSGNQLIVYFVPTSTVEKVYDFQLMP